MAGIEVGNALNADTVGLRERPEGVACLYNVLCRIWGTCFIAHILTPVPVKIDRKNDFYISSFLFYAG